MNASPPVRPVDASLPSRYGVGGSDRARNLRSLVVGVLLIVGPPIVMLVGGAWLYGAVPFLRGLLGPLFGISE